jgi:hypothetical protein
MAVFAFNFATFAFVFCWSILGVKSVEADTGMRLTETDIDIDLGVVRIGGALIVDLVVGFEGACAA